MVHFGTIFLEMDKKWTSIIIFLATKTFVFHLFSQPFIWKCILNVFSLILLYWQILQSLTCKWKHNDFKWILFCSGFQTLLAVVVSHFATKKNIQGTGFHDYPLFI